MQDDSNGESTFEIIDKKADDNSAGEKTESMSSMSSSISLLQSPGASVTSVTTGNLLSNVSPPAALPSFVSSSYQPTVQIAQPIPTPVAAPLIEKPVSVPLTPAMSSANEPFLPTQFSAAIPPSKGVVVQPNVQPAEPHLIHQDSGGLLGWMKGAVASGGLLSKVAERAKHSVDSMITTLDPQMREYIYSGGDLDVLVASDNEIIVGAVREAFLSVFGKATITGICARTKNVAPQPVGFKAAVKAAEERIQIVLQQPKVQEHPAPVVAIENFILEVEEDKWYDLGVLMLTDPMKQISLQTFTQMTPVPTAIVNLAQEDTKVDYPLRQLGLEVPIGSLMANNLHVHHSEWHEALTAVSRREIILMAAKQLATLYKNIINN